MAAIDLKQLVGRLNEPSRRALEAAAGLTLSRTHYNVEIEHWLIKLLEADGTDLQAILRHYSVDDARVKEAMVRSLTGQRAARGEGASRLIVEFHRPAYAEADGLRWAIGRSKRRLIALSAYGTPAMQF